MRVIKVLNKEKALELETMGFYFVKERVGEGKFVYVFLESPELIKQMSKYSKSDFYFSKTLNF